MSKIIGWKLVGYDEDNNEVEIDVDNNGVAQVIDDHITEKENEDEV
tara:strand:+ start:292 stop:429 length:138 start_codon:yes stop_codon:yes gene_type:complete